MISAHWEAAPLALGATTTVPLTYDFWGFEDRYYQVRYPAPGAPELASDVRKLLRTAGTPVEDIPGRGLDHGAYVPLVEMYPAADVPVLQVSMPTLDPTGLYEIGRKLRPLRDEGVLIVGSGFFTHNLRALSPAAGSSRSWPSSTTGAARRWPAVIWTPCWTSSTRPRPPTRLTLAPSTSPRCSSRSARPTATWPTPAP